MIRTYDIIFFIIIFSIAVSGCLQEKARYSDVTVFEAKEMIDLGNVFILDVRTQEEYESGHIRNSKSIPLYLLDMRLKEIPQNRKILVYSREGVQGALASEFLSKNGYLEVYNMKGGINEWINSGIDEPEFFKDPNSPGSIIYTGKRFEAI